MPMEIDEALMRGLNPALVDEEGSIEISEEEAFTGIFARSTPSIRVFTSAMT